MFALSIRTKTDMNNNKLTLNIHFIPGNRGSLVFKKTEEGCGQTTFRINRLCNALGFMGSMKQLIMGIAWGGEQHSFYPLRNDAGRECFLYCRTEAGQIRIEVCSVPDGEPVFEWKGSVEGFRNAVEGMIAERYLFFV